MWQCAAQYLVFSQLLTLKFCSIKGLPLRETEKWVVMENGERLMSVAVCNSSGLERNICQKMRKGENNYGKYNERGIWIRIGEHLQKINEITICN